VTRVVLFSYGRVIAPLRALFADVGADLVAVVLPSNRSDEAVADGRAAAGDLPLLIQPRRADVAPFADELRRLEPDVLVVWHYSMLLPPEVLRVPPRGTVNVHGGLLPDYRGGHVLQWAIVNGERETGVTLHYVDETIDTGPVIAEAVVPIADDDDAATVAAGLETAGARLLRDHWHAIAAGTADATAQEPGVGTYWPLRTPADGVVDWSASATQIRNLVRALVSPWPGATTTVRGEPIVVERVDVVEGAGSPGTVLAIAPGRVVVAAGEQAVAITSVRRGGEHVDPASLPVDVGARVGT
jgi:methionyl-tRNA formyltransferase